MLQDSATRVIESMLWFHDAGLMVMLFLVIRVGFFMLKLIFNSLSCTEYIHNDVAGII